MTFKINITNLLFLSNCNILGTFFDNFEIDIFLMKKKVDSR